MPTVMKPNLPKGSLPEESRCFINGQFVQPSGPEWETINPATEEVICKIKEASTADVDKAVQAAHAAFPAWSTTDGRIRSKMMMTLADLIEEHTEQLAELESRDNGKPLSVASTVDLPLTVETIRYYAGWADKIVGEQVPIKSLDTSVKYLTICKREPIGVVAQVIPWNFPLLMLAWKIGPALATGCTVVLKTSEKTPLSALMLAHLVYKAEFPSGVLNIITGRGPSVGEHLVRHPLVDKIAFTGSTAVGKSIASYAAQDGLKRTTMELGGKSPLIVLQDADVKKAAEIAHGGLFFNMGQCCVASSRVFVHESIFDAFVAQLVPIAQKAVMAPPADCKCTQGPQVDKIQFDKILQFIETGKSEGATCLTGGKRFGNKGYYIEPTVFTNVTDKMKIAKEEIFGPVIVVMKFSTLPEVLERANATPYGLGAGIITKDYPKALKLAQEIKAGTVYINCFAVFDPAAPFGGFKQSGVGRELGARGLDAYLEWKTMIMDVTVPEGC
eukprot:GHVT01101381.1.p1 GENE.GHVT01101381.1~~GHVT01101381.1.p1  ORF type:complete len:522 (+),score=77.17 GHVT01101381.1:66-1568(+)